MNSKRKGKVGELELSKILREHGFTDARRTAQYCGQSGDAADVVGIDGYHIEVKRCERLNLSEAVAQARRDAHGKPYIVCHRRSRERWLATMDLEQLLRILKQDQEPQRICDVCGKQMSEGYVIDSQEYYCSTECLHTVYTDEAYEEMYRNNVGYWTEWED